jgi:cold shock CspA family protein
MDSIIQKGILKYWNQQKAYGIIRTANALNVWSEFFCHISQCTGDPVVGCQAEFIIGTRTKGALLPALQVKFFPKVEITASLIATLSTAAVQS